MALLKKNIQTQNVQIFVDVAGSTPGNLVQTDMYVECILELSGLSQTRATEKYSCMSSNSTFFSSGAIETDPLTLTTNYSEDGGGNGGYDYIQNAFETNTQIAVLIQFDNGTTLYDDVAGGSGTTILSDVIVTKFNMTFEKDRLVGAEFELNYQGAPFITPAT